MGPDGRVYNNLRSPRRLASHLPSELRVSTRTEPLETERNSTAPYCWFGNLHKLIDASPRGWRAAPCRHARRRCAPSCRARSLRGCAGSADTGRPRRAAAAHGSCGRDRSTATGSTHSALKSKRSSMVRQPPSSARRSTTFLPSAPPYSRPGPSCASASSVPARSGCFSTAPSVGRPPLDALEIVARPFGIELWLAAQLAGDAADTPRR